MAVMTSFVICAAIKIYFSVGVGLPVERLYQDLVALGPKKFAIYVVI